MKGAGTRDRTLIRAIVSWAGVDLFNIRKEFWKNFATSLYSMIKGDTSGDYKKARRLLCGGGDGGATWGRTSARCPPPWSLLATPVYAGAGHLALFPLDSHDPTRVVEAGLGASFWSYSKNFPSVVVLKSTYVTKTKVRSLLFSFKR